MKKIQHILFLLIVAIGWTAVVVFLLVIDTVIFRVFYDSITFRVFLLVVNTGLVFLIAYSLFVRKDKKIKQEFITVAAHKLRVPLTRIKFAAITLAESFSVKDSKDTLALIERQRALTQEIIENNNRLIELINVLLEVVEGRDKEKNIQYFYHFRPVDLRSVVYKLLSDHHQPLEAKQLSVTFEPPLALPEVWADYEKIMTVLEILLQNAIAYTPSKGKITITLFSRSPSQVFCSITDTGMGIEPADIQHIFSNFFRSKQALLVDTEGSGIGLSLTKGIIERHKGSISVRSAGSNQGSTFTFSLPIAGNSSAPSQT